jgi:L-rhamnose-H+ transport protein
VTPGIVLALISGACNGLFTAPMKIIPRWKWENIWLVFIVVSCLIMPFFIASSTAGDFSRVIGGSPRRAVHAAVLFGFMWGFGAILFGLSVNSLGVALANSLVIGISSALGSLVPLALSGALRWEPRQRMLYLGVLLFLAGVGFCGVAGRHRDPAPSGSAGRKALLTGYLCSVGAGIMSAVFNIGYSLALPIADTGVRMGVSRFGATNCIWLLMLAAGSIPNIVYCSLRLRRNRTARLFRNSEPRAWAFSVLMGLLWGGSIFLYGAATPLLGDMGPSIGWPLSLAVGLVVANIMGILLAEWKTAGTKAIRLMSAGIAMLLAAIIVCAISTRTGV